MAEILVSSIVFWVVVPAWSAARQSRILTTIAPGRLTIYTFCVHNNHSAMTLPFSSPVSPAPRPAVRTATRADVDQIWELVTLYAAEGLVLPRTHDQIAMCVDNYIVATRGSRVVACAALDEYSPSLAEVSSVAVAKSEQGSGLGSGVVLGVERLARARGIDEVFAMSLSDRFFLSLDYAPTSISRYPEKLARYGRLVAEGVDIVPKRCFQKILGATWEAPVIAVSKPRKRIRRAS